MRTLLDPLLACLGCAVASAGCIVPIQLDQQNGTDGGQLLVVQRADPAFGVGRALRQTDPMTFSVEIESDADNLYGRLYWQVNGLCCELNPRDVNVTHYITEVQGLKIGPGLFRMVWSGVLPCYQPVPPAAMAYLVPVIATGPFIQGPTEGIGAQGAVDRSHFWGIICPS